MEKLSDIRLNFLDYIIEFGLYVTIFGIPISNAFTSVGMGITIAAWIVRKVLEKKFNLNNPFFFLLVCFLFWNLLSLVNSQNMHDSLRGINKVIKFAVFFLAVFDTLRNEKILKRLFTVLVASSVLVCINGIFQNFYGFDFLRQHRVDMGESLRRLTASFTDPNNFGGFLVIAIPVFLALILAKVPKRIKLFILMPAVAGLMFCLYRTSSRGAWLGLAVSVLALCVLKKSKAVIAGLVVLALVFFIFAPGVTKDRLKSAFVVEHGNPTWERVKIWQGASNMVAAHPVLGIGVNNFVSMFPRYKPADYPDNRYAHNSFLQMAAEVGIPGVLIFILFLFFIFKNSLGALNRSSSWIKDAGIGLWCGLLGFNVHAAVDTHLYSLVMAALFWLSAGILAGYCVVFAQKPKRILLVRTDRIGDLLLNTPAIKAIRQAYPESRISMVVNPNSKEAIEKNKDIDEIICFDDKVKNKLSDKLGLFFKILSSRFDMAVMLNPSRFFNIQTHVAGIPKRVGYDKKLGFLLTDKIEDKKYLAEKHEIEYNLDLAAVAGARAGSKDLVFEFGKEDEDSVNDILNKQGLRPAANLVAIHPGTSNPQKKWDTKKFAQLADKLIQDHGAIVCVVGSREEAQTARELAANMKQKAIDLTGKLSLKELGAFLKKCKALVSNDSGPVHIASAVKTPVVAIFAKGVQGAEPARWAPLNKNSQVIYEKLDELSVDKVLEAVKKVISNQ